MGTQAWIGVKDRNGLVQVALLGMDGDSALPELQEHYNNVDLALELVEVGEFRGFNSDGSPSVYDDAQYFAPLTEQEFSELTSAPYAYIYKDSVWTLEDRR